MADVELPKPDEIEEQKGNGFTRLAAVVVAGYAVALAITSLGGNNAMKEMLSAQQEASNQWAFYQAKVIREHMYASQSEMLEALAPAGATGAGDSVSARAKKFRDKAAEYAGEKDQIKQEAQRHEEVVKLNRRKDPYFDYAEVLLQIAIVVASVSMLADSRWLFGLSVVMATAGIFLTYDGYTLHFPLPFLG